MAPRLPWLGDGRSERSQPFWSHSAIRHRQVERAQSSCSRMLMFSIAERTGTSSVLGLQTSNVMTWTWLTSRRHLTRHYATWRQNRRHACLVRCEYFMDVLVLTVFLYSRLCWTFLLDHCVLCPWSLSGQLPPNGPQPPSWRN